MDANQAQEMELKIKVIRADGTVEDLGRVAYWHKNPIIRWWRNRKIK